MMRQMAQYDAVDQKRNPDIGSGINNPGSHHQLSDLFRQDRRNRYRHTRLERIEGAARKLIGELWKESHCVLEIYCGHLDRDHATGRGIALTVREPTAIACL
jgi:hypothetical protein